MKPSLGRNDHDLLAARIRAAEARTTGEIYCVVARSSDSYFHPAALAVTVAIVLLGIPLAWWLDRGWLPVSHAVFALAELAALASALAALWLAPALRILLVPRRLRYRRAHDNALKQFLAHNIHLTSERTGVFIFVSLAERYGEIVADAGIDAAVAQDEWNGIVAALVDDAGAGRLVEGLSRAIDGAGELLARHFPGGTGNPNELEDHVVEI